MFGTGPRICSGKCFDICDFYGLLPEREAFPRARAAAATALELSFYYDWNWSAAETQLKHILELRPDYTTARQWHTEYLVAMGQPDAAIAEIRRAQEYDPLSPLMKAMEGYVDYFAGRYDQAIAACKGALDLDPNFLVAYLWIARSYEMKGMYGLAIDHFKKAAELGGGKTWYEWEIAHLDAHSGKHHEAFRRLDHILRTNPDGPRSATRIGLIYAALGDRDTAMVWLERAYREREASLTLANVSPWFAPLRSDPRFQDLLRRMNFPQ